MEGIGYWILSFEYLKISCNTKCSTWQQIQKFMGLYSMNQPVTITLNPKDNSQELWVRNSVSSHPFTGSSSKLMNWLWTQEKQSSPQQVENQWQQRPNLWGLCLLQLHLAQGLKWGLWLLKTWKRSPRAL